MNGTTGNSAAAGFRAVPGCVVRRAAFIAPGVVLMPSFVNLGAYVDSGTMIDTWATVGSCAQIGKNCHISGGVGIGGVLEPLQAGPVIVEDNCFIGARSEVAEGVIVREGAVLSMGVFIGASTKIVDRDTGEVIQGEVPAYSVVVPGTMAGRPDKKRRGKPKSILCGHRQTRRRKDPRQDQYQRTVARLNSRGSDGLALFLWLLDGFHGRIGRKTFWIAMIVVGAANMAACSCGQPDPRRSAERRRRSRLHLSGIRHRHEARQRPQPAALAARHLFRRQRGARPVLGHGLDRHRCAAEHAVLCHLGAVHRLRHRLAGRTRLPQRHGRPEPTRAGSARRDQPHKLDCSQ